MATMNISVPEAMREWVQRRIENGQYASVSDYVRDLIRRDQAQLGSRGASLTWPPVEHPDCRADGHARGG